MSDTEQPEGSPQPKQVDSPDHRSRNYTAAQTCGWTANALCGEGKANGRTT